ncbi:MAG: type 1 glutamine amidotransferase [Anaerolineae bacterium]
MDGSRTDRSPLTRRAFLRLLGLASVGELLSACGSQALSASSPFTTFAPTPDANPTRTQVPTSAPTGTPVPTRTATATATATPTVPPTATATPTLTATPPPTPTPTPTRGPLQAIVLIHGPSRFLVVDHVLQRLGVESTAIQVHKGEPVPDLRAYDAVICAGGEYRPNEFELPIFKAERVRIMEALDARVPILGICLGHQLLAYWLGGKVVRGKWEIGWLPVTANQEGQSDPLLDGLDQTFHAFLWHGDQISRLPEEAILLASSELCRVQAYRLRDRLVWGVQFNPQYDPQIAETLVRNTGWLTKYGWDPDEIIATGYAHYDDLADKIFGNFFQAVLDGESAHATSAVTPVPRATARGIKPR